MSQSGGPNEWKRIQQSNNDITKMADLGSKSTDSNSNWDGIIQPCKPDMLVLLDEMLMKSEKTDIDIHIGTAVFHCHLMLLQCYSGFFMELTNEQVIFLPPEKITPDAFVMIYDWMLASNPKVQRKDLLELFTAAQFLRIKELEDECWACLDDEQIFREDSAFILYMEARKYGLKSVQDLMLTRVCKFFLTLVSSKDFLELSAQEVCALLQSNSIGVNGEIEVFMAAVRWLHFNWTDREKYLIDVMKCIRFGLMTQWQIVDLRSNPNPECEELLHITSCKDVRKMLDEGLSYTTAKYCCRNNTEKLVQLLERLHLQEPLERQWIRDKIYTENFTGPNHLFASYKNFIEYLEIIKKCGKEHWKSLVTCKRCPNLVDQGSVSGSGDRNRLQNNFTAVLETNKS